jgi:protein TonB
MSKLFKMRPQTKDGAPVGGGTVRIPLSFRLPKE